MISGEGHDVDYNVISFKGPGVDYSVIITGEEPGVDFSVIISGEEPGVDFSVIISGEGPGVQPAHDSLRHSEDEGIPGRSWDALRSDVPHCQGLPKLSRSQTDLAPKHGQQTQWGKLK